MDPDVTPDVNPPWQVEETEVDPLVASGVLAPKHAETRAFLEMAGKSLPSQQAQGGSTGGTD